MPVRGQRLSALLSLTFVFALAAPAFGAALDMDAFRWTDELGSSPLADGQVAPGRLIVRFAQGAQPQAGAARADGSIETGELALDRVAEQIGTYAIERMFPELSGARRAMDLPERSEFFIVRFDPERSSVLDAAREIARLDGVVSVEPDEVYRLDAALPNDPSLPNQWWLRNTALGQADIGAVGAWNYSTGSGDVIVCVADSGVDWQHPDLGGTGPDYTDGVIYINPGEYGGLPGVDDDGNGFVDDIRGYDFVNVGTSGTQQNPPQDVVIRDNDPMDYDGHGTAVSGCISAISNNGVGIASSNWNVKILPCKIGVTTSDGQGIVYMSYAAQAMDYSRLIGVDVFNASWGSSGSLNTAANLLNAAGIVLVESAGNGNNETPSYLGTRNDVVSVAATTQGDGRAGFSTYGTWVDISAPGVAIYTTSMIALETLGDVSHTYTSIQGTSFSSPIVAGAMAMAKSYWPGDSRQQTIDRVLAAVDDISAQNPGIATKMGSGRLNLTKLFYDGTIWPVPGMMPELIDALQSADVGDTVAVEGGFTMNGPLLFPAGLEAMILGGFDATYTSRDPVGNPSVMQLPAGNGAVVTFGSGVGPDMVLDGFEITGGLMLSPTLAPDEGFYGGGIQMFNASPTLKNLKVTGNQAGQSGEAGYGGGIAILSSSPTLENVEVFGNSAMSGAGIYAYDSTPVFTNVSVHDNTAWGSNFGENPRGGGMFLRACPPSGSPIVIDGGDFTNNSSAGPGGGISGLDSDLIITNATFDMNTSVAEGAGVAVFNGSLEMQGCVVTNNSVNPGPSLKQGGGVYADGGVVTFDDLDVRGNSSTFAGGAIAVNAPTTFAMTNSTLVDNTAAFFGAGLYVNAGTTGMSLAGNTVASNSGGSVGGNGIYISGGDVDLQQNVIAFNVDGSGTPNGIYLVSATATFTCNLLHGNADGNVGGAADPIGSNGNIDEDPLFCDAVAGEYTLSVNSPAVTAPCGAMGSEPTDCGQGTGVSDDTPQNVGRRFALEQNRPNPFNPSTLIEFSVPTTGPVQLKIFDVRGRLVRTLLNRSYEAGSWSVTWDGRDDGGRSVASGTYLYELRAEGERKVRKMGLLK